MMKNFFDLFSWHYFLLQLSSFEMLWFLLRSLQLLRVVLSLHLLLKLWVKLVREVWRLLRLKSLIWVNILYRIIIIIKLWLIRVLNLILSVWLIIYWLFDLVWERHIGSKVLLIIWVLLIINFSHCPSFPSLLFFRVYLS